MISENLQSRYRDLGYYFPVSVLEAAQAVFLLEEVLALRQRLSGASKISKVQLHFRWAYDLVLHPAILNAVELVLGPDVLVHTATVFFKESDGTTHVDWHQDGYYLGLSEPEYLTAWVALTPSHPGNGGLQIIPASHQRELEHIDGFGTKGERKPLSTCQLVLKIDQADAVDIVLAPGEMSLHHVNLVHGSPPNRSGAPRVGVAIRYVSAGITQKRSHHPVILARGENRAGHYELATVPPAKDVEAGLAARAAFYRGRDIEALRRPS
jgi:non-heme Fe2+,alpha-ketoglutarate-dependent halogenase